MSVISVKQKNGVNELRRRNSTKIHGAKFEFKQLDCYPISQIPRKTD